jgi:hypothetical protein
MRVLGMESTTFSDTFDGDTPALLAAADALLDLDERGALVPHGVGGLARRVIGSLAARLEPSEREVGLPAVATTLPPLKRVCDGCEGTGDGATAYHRCPTCGGRREVPTEAGRAVLDLLDVFRF